MLSVTSSIKFGAVSAILIMLSSCGTGGPSDSDVVNALQNTGYAQDVTSNFRVLAKQSCPSASNDAVYNVSDRWLYRLLNPNAVDKESLWMIFKKDNSWRAVGGVLNCSSYIGTGNSVLPTLPAVKAPAISNDFSLAQSTVLELTKIPAQISYPEGWEQGWSGAEGRFFIKPTNVRQVSVNILVDTTASDYPEFSGSNKQNLLDYYVKLAVGENPKLASSNKPILFKLDGVDALQLDLVGPVAADKSSAMIRTITAEHPQTKKLLLISFQCIQSDCGSFLALSEEMLKSLKWK